MVAQVPGTVRVALNTFRVHAYHWYVNVGAGDPAHVPFRTVKVLPTLAMPLIVGVTMFRSHTTATATGTFLAVLLPSPSCPSLFYPQQVTVPSEINAHV